MCFDGARDGVLISVLGLCPLVGSDVTAGSDGPQVIGVVDTAAALAHHPAMIGSIAAGLFPRDLSLDPATGQVLVTNFNSGTVEVFTSPVNAR